MNGKSDYDRIIELCDKIKKLAELCRDDDARIVKVNGNRVMAVTSIELNQEISKNLQLDY